MQKAGIEVLGYISSEESQEAIEAWKAHYQPDGVFLEKDSCLAFDAKSMGIKTIF